MIVVPQPPPVAASRRIALKVDVRTYRGAVYGVPRLLAALRKRTARATFLFALGKDRSGRAHLSLGPRAMLRKLGRHSLLSHYGYRTLLYGTLVPGPDIGARCSGIMRSVRDLGHEVGIHAWDAARWQRTAASSDAHWTREQMRQASDRFESIFGEPARVHGAVGWQMNRHAFRLTQRLGFDYCSDTRGTRPYIPVLDAELIACPQIPTTLPTLEELLARDGATIETTVAELLALTRIAAPEGHVYTLRAELEGSKLLPAFEQLLDSWCAQGMEFLTLNSYLESAGIGALPRHRVTNERVDGGAEALSRQGREFLV